MPTEPIVIEGNCWKGYQLTVLALVQGVNGPNVTQADVASITCKVFDSCGNEVASPAVVVAESVFDTLQLDRGWDQDSTGYNFRHTIPGSAFPNAGVYGVCYEVTPPGQGEPYPIVARVTAREVVPRC